MALFNHKYSGVPLGNCSLTHLLPLDKTNIIGKYAGGGVVISISWVKGNDIAKLDWGLVSSSVKDNYIKDKHQRANNPATSIDSSTRGHAVSFLDWKKPSIK